jgi:hypothetical protein
MALQQRIDLPNRTFGTYIRLGDNRRTSHKAGERAAVAHFHLFVDRKAADDSPGDPVTMVAAIKLKNERFDQYFSKAALAAVGGDVDSQFYAVLKSAKGKVALEMLKNGELLPGGGLTSLDFSDATDV